MSNERVGVNGTTGSQRDLLCWYDEPAAGRDADDRAELGRLLST
jgi:hypothetical protein